MLVRDGREGLEVFMLRRSLEAVFVGGAYVFPGGAVDPVDRQADLEAVCVGRTDAEVSAALGLERGGLAFWVAAIRECFEEAGVLLALRDGEPVTLRDPEVAARFARHRAAVYSGERRLVELCGEEGLTLAVDRIHYFAHWITPAGSPRRFDTRFFVAPAPTEQEALHDDRETIANVWIRPADALAQREAGTLQMIAPTIRNLEAIARFDAVADLLAAAAAVEQIPDLSARFQLDATENYGRRIVLPGDPGYDIERLRRTTANGRIDGLPGSSGVPEAGRVIER
jgi:8-oxo-dGTP pyrophosphatase MutT (NUDIX family)